MNARDLETGELVDTPAPRRRPYAPSWPPVPHRGGSTELRIPPPVPPAPIVIVREVTPVVPLRWWVFAGCMTALGLVGFCALVIWINR